MENPFNVHNDSSHVPNGVPNHFHIDVFKALNNVPTLFTSEWRYFAKERGWLLGSKKQKYCIALVCSFLGANFILHIINEPLFIALGLLNAFQLHSFAPQLPTPITLVACYEVIGFESLIFLQVGFIVLQVIECFLGFNISWNKELGLVIKKNKIWCCILG